MNGKIYSLPVKTAAVILFVVISVITAFSGIAFAYMFLDSVYYSSDNADEAYYGSQLCRMTVNNTHYIVFSNIMSYNNHNGADLSGLTKYVEREQESNYTIRLTIYDSERNALIELGRVPDDYGYEYNREYSVYDNGEESDWYSVDLTLYVKKPLLDNKDSFTHGKMISDIFFSIRYLIIYITALGLLALVILYVFLLKAAGRRYGEEGVDEGYFFHIPYDIILATVAFIFTALIFLTASVINNGISSSRSFIIEIFSVALICAFGALIFLALSATTAVRIKKRRLFRNTVIWRICVWFYKLICKILHGIAGFFKMLPVVPKAILITAGYLFINFIFLVSLISTIRVTSNAIIIWFFLLISCINIALLVGYIKTVYCASLVRQGSERLAGGNLDYKFNESALRGEARAIASNLNRLGDGLSAAVEQRSRSERMKVELITNVSHDLKTPITSIINYVDLLKKEPMPNDAAVEYLNVLDRQSARLRKLTSDLVEASKASTGNIEVNSEPTDICELLDQSAAEYADRFAEAGLTLIIRTPGVPIIVNADGKLLWRVFDNLLSNICKYSQPGTRVYLDATAGEGAACVSMRNISSQQIEVSPDELTERFVRGDTARSGEGSGLGLSIARNLTELQGGRLSIEIDGDLFKASVTLPL